ncbi:MAG: modification methylase [Candidatus Aenigmarchaeota archaeon ex4484_52]|nr:MAG: modification methylase [Candidatus Aenigmarchaeota archaeon ex4484_52]
MKTEHKIIFGDARDMKQIKSESVDLIITSPPYPMIKMWDEMFGEQNPEITKALKEENGEKAFELMHKELDKVWNETFRVLKNGGIACINIGDATRTLKNVFQIYTSHVRILNHCLKLGFHALPEILWIKETNKPDKFMGSGMLPVGAYVTLEHEHILVLRKDGKRPFKKEEEKELRRRSAFFWEERNIWFSDKWKDVKGINQGLKNKNLRERSGAYPLELAYRLINMFSIQRDVVLDPYLGTGTTTIGAIVSGRNSIGFEIDPNFKEIVEERITEISKVTNELIDKRIESHKEFVKKRIEEKEELKYINENYGFPVMTRQELKLKFLKLKLFNKKSEGIFEAEYN